MHEPPVEPMHFRVQAHIARSPDVVFAHLRDIEHEPRPRSLVPVLERTTPGPCGVGARYREVVRMLPGVAAEIISEVTTCAPPSALSYRFLWRCLGARMSGALSYLLFPAASGGTTLVQHQWLEPHGALRLLAPWMRRSFQRRIERRILDLKAGMERDLAWRPPPARSALLAS